MIKTEGVLCGCYTSKNWDRSCKYIEDSDAFIFNMIQRYNILKKEKAIFHSGFDGRFCFANGTLKVSHFKELNSEHAG